MRAKTVQPKRAGLKRFELRNFIDADCIDLSLLDRLLDA